MLTNLLLVFLAAWVPQHTPATVGFRGLKALPGGTAWVSGAKGTWLRTTNGGHHWQSGVVPDAESLDFRGLEALDANAAWLMSSGEGDKSRIFHTADGGRNWTLQFTNPDPKGFWDAIRFWDPQHGILLGDPVDGRFVIFTTVDGGHTWQRRATPPALPDEGAFAASNSSLAVLGKSEVWFGTGGQGAARVFHSTDRGASWRVSSTPIRNGSKTAGIFSLLFLNSRYGVAVGGDYAKPDESTRNIAITTDGGYTWTQPATRPAGYRSGIAFHDGERLLVAVGPNGSDISRDYGKTWTRVDSQGFNAVAFAPKSKKNVQGWAAGPEGRVAAWTSLPTKTQSKR
ncbi:MAG: glycosyl hydrolase, repeat-containing protein [Bryobacterales bacterium]|nr:glycosyl hydrolase, repeat-containing protein [Bryobacterales bacterium]